MCKSIKRLLFTKVEGSRVFSAFLVALFIIILMIVIQEAPSVKSLLFKSWEVILGLVGAFIGVWKYFDTRKRELAWRRTEFIFEQAYILDSDKDISEAVCILEDRHEKVKLDEVFKEGNKDYLRKIDKLLNLLDRLAYAIFNAKTLTIDEIANFGWYLRKIDEEKSISQYCDDEGFEDVIKLAKKYLKQLRG